MKGKGIKAAEGNGKCLPLYKGQQRKKLPCPFSEQQISLCPKNNKYKISNKIACYKIKVNKPMKRVSNTGRPTTVLGPTTM